MNVTDHLSFAYNLAFASQKELDEKWISLSRKFGADGKGNRVITTQRLGRLDLMLRSLETDHLAQSHYNSDDRSTWALDLQFMLSESWVLSAYELVRAINSSDKSIMGLVPLAHRLALVRMPIAKGQIQGMNRRVNRENPPQMVRHGDSQPHTYLDNGSYMAPCGLCNETGAAVWYPTDVSTRQTVDICRRDLSDEMLALFEV